ncbi:DUF3306 domain-containing protein [Vibrio rumoiensis]|uniref:DUF3306 domain-containing protein n=1 Tax=Vibrio rumoiensis TaxID=76258 RepID=UPI003AA7EA42
MVTNRFQRWLTKKNKSLEENQEVDVPITAQFDADALDLKTVTLNEETLTDSKTDSSLPSHQQPNDHTSHRDESEGETNQDLPLTTIAHVFSEGFSKQEKQQQLRALFHSDEFSDIDPLDSYNMDYTKVKSLPKDVADTLRSWHKRVEEVLDENEDTGECLTGNTELAQAEQVAYAEEKNDQPEVNSSEASKNNQASPNKDADLAKVAIDEDNKKSG